MNIGDVPAFLGRRVPALAGAIGAEVDRLRSTYGEDTPVTDPILGTLLAPLTSQMLRSGDPDDTATLRSLFAALDDLLDDPNPNLPDVVFVSFLEPLAQDRNDWERARAYMGERMRREVVSP